MALGDTIYVFDIELANSDSGVTSTGPRTSPNGFSAGLLSR